MSLSIRRFRPGDLDRVREIETASFRDPWPRSTFTHIHGKAPDLLLVAVLGGEVVGYTVGELELSPDGIPHRFKRGHILNIAVDASHRREGVGAHLLGEIEDEFRERNATEVTLEVRESNISARSLYKHMGYEETGRSEAYYHDEDAVIMSKALLSKRLKSSRRYRPYITGPYH